VTDPRTQLVGAGYDAMIDTWEAWVARIEDDPRHVWLAELMELVGEGERVVELGCGGGTRETRDLAASYVLTGVDLSSAQLARARERVPAAEFVQTDFTSIEFEPGSLGGVAAFYSFNHVPRELLAPLFARIHSWLRPGGVLLAALGVGDENEWYGDFLGAPSFFSSFPPETNSRLVREAGFELRRNEVVSIREPEGPVDFQWILAVRP
jgi:SAM-dependent methyltransferase